MRASGLTLGLLELCLALEAAQSRASGPAGIKLDGTLGPSAAALAGPTYALTQNLGKLSGGNLFFSFQYFNLATGETALFTTTSAGINNVISRVTGGFASTIDGRIELQAASGAPNFFLINPNGVSFTANAVIDVPAAFYVSTANYLKFSDGNFYVDPSRMSALSAAAPEAFGFLGTTRAPVNIHGANLSAGANGTGDFQIAAGDVSVDGGGGYTAANGAIEPLGISNTSGSIRVSAVGSASAEVPLSGPFAATDGAVTITNAAALITQGVNSLPSGNIEVNAGSLLIDGQYASALTGIYAGGNTGAPGLITVAIGHDAQIIHGGSILSFNASADAAASVSVSAGTVTIDGGNSSNFTGIESVSAASGSGAPIQVAVAGASTISNGGALYSLAEAAGNGGDIVLTSGALQLTSADAAVNTLIEAATLGGGNSGSVQISADSLTMTAPPSTTQLPVDISTGAFSGSSGAAGAVNVQVSGHVSIAGAAGITSNTYSSGNAGQVNVQALGTLTMSDDADIASEAYGSGNGGNVSVAAAALDILGIASASDTLIATETYTAGSAGALTIHAGSLLIDGAGSNLGFTGIYSASNATGAGGPIQIDVTGAATLANGGSISSTANAQGNGGNVSVTAAALAIDGVATAVSTNIATASYAAGNAGAITVQAGSLLIDGAGSNLGFTGINSTSNAAGAGGLIQIDVSGAATLSNGGFIGSTAYAQGNAGSIVMSSGTLLLQDTGSTTSDTGLYSNTLGAGNAGAIHLTANSLTMSGPAVAYGEPVTISSGAFAGSGAAGNIGVDVSGDIALTGDVGIASNSYASGNAGQVSVETLGKVSLLSGAVISSDSVYPATGNAGAVTLTAASLDIEGGSTPVETGLLAASGGPGNAGNIEVHVGSLSIDGGTGGGGGIQAFADGSGSGGQIHLDVTGNAILADSAQISATTFGSGNAGNIALTAANLTLEANANANTAIFADTLGSGNAGSIQINVGSLTMSSVATSSGNVPVSVTSDAMAGSSGAAGNVTVDVTGGISITGIAAIGSNTYTSRNAGQVVVNAGGTILLQDGAYFSSISNGGSGNAGDISVDAAKLDIEGQGSILTGISTESFGAGNSGTIKVQVGSLLLDGGGSGGSGTVIDSEVFPEGASVIGGAGGSIVVGVAGNATLRNGSKISTTSYGSGPAGDVSVSAGSLSIGGGSFRSIISSGARAGSAGQPGNVTIDTGTLDILSNGSINISNNATISDPSAITPTKIAITADQIDMDDGVITAASTGNIAASAIDIRYGSGLRMDPSTISTSSQDGNGGPITIDGAGPLLISHSNITTSVLGTSNGNGGDISIDVPVVALDSGAIQANTLAPLASGGTVTINAQALVPSYQSFILGGSALAFNASATGLNVVQAAAPDGVNGALSVTVPTLDLGNALLGLTGRPSAPVMLGRDLCGSTRGSSLAVTGRGGVAPTAYDPLWIEAHVDSSMAAANGERSAWREAACR